MFATATRNTEQRKQKIQVLPTVVLVLILLGMPTQIYAAGTYDQTLATYAEDFADNTGLASRSNTSTDGALKLTNGSGVITTPYVASGTATTNVIIPNMVAAWGTLTISKTEPAGTAVKVQFLDEAGSVFDDELLNGNEAGFTGTSIDLSTLPIDRSEETGSSKIARIALKFTLTSSDNSVTPSVESFTFGWTKSQGDLSSSALASGWAQPDGDLFNRAHISGSAEYVIPRWIKDQGVDFGGYTLRGEDEIIYSKTQGGIVSWPTTTDSTLSALDRRTGATLWTKDIAGLAFTSQGAALAADGSIYMNDSFNDVLIAYDGDDGSVKWSNQFTSGHGNSIANIGTDGTIYIVRTDSSDDAFTVIAYNPDGTVEWSTSQNPAAEVATGQVSVHGGKVYVPISGMSGGNYTNTGSLYAFDSATGSLLWTYATGDIHTNSPIVDDDGTIYTANSSSVSGNKSIYAINPDGTLKWAHTLSSSTDYWGSMTLRSDGVLVAARINSAYPATGGALDAIDTSTGDLLWTETLTSTDDSFGSEIISDSANGVLVRSVVYTESTTLEYFDTNHANKWTWSHDSGGDDMRLNFLSGDEDGNIYISRFTGGDNGASASELIALAPWGMTISTGNDYIYDGDTIAISVTTSMPALDPIQGVANKMQAVMEDSTKVTLDYVSTDADGVALWRGNYQVPSGSTGNHAFTVEASSVMMSTDTATHFDSPAEPGNTGRVVSASFDVLQRAGSSSGSRGRNVKPIILKPKEINKPTDGACNPGEKFSTVTGLPCKSNQHAATPACSISAILKFGSRGADVKCLQSGLNVFADGIFGPQTKAAIILFQQSKNLLPDGIFGPKSLAAWNNLNG